jgi:hypothetical protein
MTFKKMEHPKETMEKKRKSLHPYAQRGYSLCRHSLHRLDVRDMHSVKTLMVV